MSSRAVSLQLTGPNEVKNSSRQTELYYINMGHSLKQRAWIIAVFICLVVLLVYLFNIRPPNTNSSRHWWPIDSRPTKLTTEITSYAFEKMIKDLNSTEQQRIVIIGAGPTSLGALYRFYDLGYSGLATKQIIVLEQELEPGGLASSRRDHKGFLWDNGGHVVFSHYEYFDNAINRAVQDWNNRKRASFAYMLGGDHQRRFIPYPVQNSIHYMDKDYQQKCLTGLEEAINARRNSLTSSIKNFDDWLLQNFGQGLCDIFMRKYNRKVWTVNTTEMNSEWVGERVAVPDIRTIKNKIATFKEGSDELKDGAWGPNRYFQFPKHGGTGGIWKRVADLLPPYWFHYGHKVVGVDVSAKRLDIQFDKVKYSLNYDTLITTMPIDTLINLASVNNDQAKELKKLTDKLVFSHTHVIGLGMKGSPPSFLMDKSWIYFPDSDSPFYRATVFSSYADDNVPNGDISQYWSLMCEAAQPKTDRNSRYWSKENLIKETIRAMILYKFIKTEDQVVSKYYYRLEHGYPVPTISRNKIVSEVQSWLESSDVYSRGRFGGWKYEVGNQDHSFMQGVEIADRIVLSIPEETYPNPNLVNTMKATNRTLPIVTAKAIDYEFVVVNYNEKLDKMLPYANYSNVYHKQPDGEPDFRFRTWTNLPNIGREGYAYLYHIVHNYDRLANITVFIQAGSNGLENEHCYNEDPYKYVSEVQAKGFAVKRTLQLTKPEYTRQIPGSLKRRGHWIIKSNYSMSEFWQIIFGYPIPETIQWSQRGCFGVNKARVHKRPKAFYEKLMGYLAINWNPQEGHYLERMWVSIFTLEH